MKPFLAAAALAVLLAMPAAFAQPQPPCACDPRPIADDVPCLDAEDALACAFDAAALDDPRALLEPHNCTCDPEDTEG